MTTASVVLYISFRIYL